MNTHGCPGCGKQAVPARFAGEPVPGGPRRLPEPVREDISVGWRGDRELHRGAMVAAMDWFADNPPRRATR